jgi:hypothetical protein
MASPSDVSGSCPSFELKLGVDETVSHENLKSTLLAFSLLNHLKSLDFCLTLINRYYEHLSLYVVKLQCSVPTTPCFFAKSAAGFAGRNIR